MSGTRRPGVGSPPKSAADDKPAPKLPRWLFPAIAGGLTAVWLVLCMPYKEDTDGADMPYTTKRAGWPDYFARWSTDNSTKATTYSAFYTGTFLFDLAVLAAPIIVAWVIIRHVNGPSAEPASRPREAARPTAKPKWTPPSKSAPASNPYPPRGPSQSGGGWG